MARLTDQETCGKILQALSEWNVGNAGIRWTLNSTDWLNKNLPGYTQREVGRLMYEHVRNGGDINRVPEQRERWRDLHEYHYDFIIMIEGYLRYIETRLIEESRVEPPHIYVVNMHEARP